MQTFERSGTVKLKSSELHYMKLGNGPSVLILFHGFGQTGEVFRPWLTEHLHTYTFYTMDIFYHGKSNRDASILSRKHWREIFEEFLYQERIKRFSLVGYSLGGRFALTTFMQLSHKINTLFLVAPDGIYRSIWYSLALKFRPIFKYLMWHPARFNQLLTHAEKYRLGDPALIKFSRKELENRADRIRVYQSWVYFQRIAYSKRKYRKVFDRASSQIQLFLGTKDPIIPAKEIASTFEESPNVELKLLKKKHHEMIAAALPSILASSATKMTHIN